MCLEFMDNLITPIYLWNGTISHPCLLYLNLAIMHEIKMPTSAINHNIILVKYSGSWTWHCFRVLRQLNRSFSKIQQTPNNHEGKVWEIVCEFWFWHLLYVRMCIIPTGRPRSVYKSNLECHFLESWFEMAKWPWRSRSMTPVFNTSERESQDVYLVQIWWF